MDQKDPPLGKNRAERIGGGGRRAIDAKVIGRPRKLNGAKAVRLFLKKIAQPPIEPRPDGTAHERTFAEIGLGRTKAASEASPQVLAGKILEDLREGGLRVHRIL